jgi:hypothetical protein
MSPALAASTVLYGADTVKMLRVQTHARSAVITVLINAFIVFFDVNVLLIYDYTIKGLSA